MKKIKKICPVCNKTYSVPFCHRQRYKTCGRKCGGIYRHKPAIINKCVNCSIEFISKKYKRIKGKFCSRKCTQENIKNSKKGQFFNCLNCNTQFYLKPCLIKQRKNRKYCSTSCVIKDWNKKSLEREMPGSYRKNAWKIYDKKCYDCGILDERVLVIHHIDGNRKNGKLDNLIPVCHNCHCIRHIKLSGNNRLPSFRYQGND